MTTPPTLWYHQHFTTTERMRYLATHGPSQGMGFRAKERGLESSQPMNRVEYDEEDPDVRDEYKRELAKRGTAFRVAEVYEKEGGRRRPSNNRPPTVGADEAAVRAGSVASVTVGPNPD